MRLLSGLRAWTLQRISAVLLLGFVLWFAVRLFVAPPQSYVEWRALVARPLAEIVLGLFFVALLLHAWVGVRDIVLDYVHPRSLRAALLIVIASLLAGTGIGLALALAILLVQ